MAERRRLPRLSRGGSTQVQTRTRRRFARRQWARRWLTWKPILAVVVALALLVTGIWLVWFSSVLAVKKVTVAGTGYLSADDIREAADIPIGEPLARVDLATIDRRVAALGPVAEVDVDRVWPDSVSIRVEEREAIAVVSIGGTMRGLDAEGVVFRTYPSKPKDLPLIQADPDTRNEAIAETAAVVGALPSDLAGRVDHVEAHTLDEITLVLKDGRTVLWGSAAESELKARVLDDLLTRRGTRFDVSVPGQPLAQG